ncbi:MAG: hypothetical protein BBJ57_02190 [Desulfobacterales bacterium PC51MH44]|nr:MAG: hypothetical protein BBJ57_02190 [Desulfobacterales bacterium PC51MH44]
MVDSDHPLAKDFIASSRTICEVHREIYNIVIGKDCVDEEIIHLLEEAFDMAKRMSKKLRQYYSNYDNGWWEKTADHKQKLDGTE